MMSEAELKELGEDIKANGLRVPITLVEWPGSPVKADDKPVALLDGRNRLDALEKTGHGIHFENNCSGWPEWFAAGWNSDGKSYAVDLSLNIMVSSNAAHAATDPYTYVISANIQRRHLTGEQKRELIAKVLKAKPEQSNRQIAKQVKSDHKTVGQMRDKMESTGEIPQLEKTTGADGKARKQPTKRKPAEQKSFDSPQEAHGSEPDTDPVDDMPTEEEADESWQNDVYDQACLLLERMAGSTRERFFAHIKRKYPSAGDDLETPNFLRRVPPDEGVA